MAVKLHRIFWLGLWLAGAVTPEGLHAALTPETLYQQVLPSVMTLEVESQRGERFVGSAVLALADDVALTAWHVVADARSVWALFADGQRVEVTGCIDHDGVRDLALLKLAKRMPHRQAALCRELQSVAARAYVIGAPRGYDFSISDGLISQIRSVNGSLQYQVSCPISTGNSGGPILNQHGEVIGIAAWTKADAQNVSFGIPIEDFVRLDVSQRPTTWEQLAATGLPAPTKSLTRLHPSTDKACEAAAGDFAALQQWLKDSVGKSVTVVVQEAGRTNVFTFTVE
ncbi:MAG: trypsin-like peptidase domain-containing protein [Verrucomicrobia bacterium]|nr:trypsin-like peptidase domain-containing protein [Verrucomicrobiota bacterium]